MTILSFRDSRASSPSRLAALGGAAALLLFAAVSEAQTPPSKLALPPAKAIPQAPPAAPQAAAPKPKHDPRYDAIVGWIGGIFPWGPGDIAVEEVTGLTVKGHKLVKVTKNFAADSRANDQAFAILDDAGRYAIIGDPFVDETRIKAPQPIRSDADLAGLREQVKRFLRGSSRLVLDPAADKQGLKGVKILVDTGYGHYEIGGFVSADDGALLLAGRAWDRKRPIAEQRKEAIKLAGTPSQGPADATVTIVEYSDMQCGFCKKRTADWEPLLAKLGSSLKIRRYFKSFPLVNDHPWAFRASAAGRCFFEKDPALFLRWKSSIYNRQETLTISDVDVFAVDFAAANDISDPWFKKCYLAEGTTSRVLADLTEGFGLRVRATPTYFIDGVAVSWFVDGLMEDFLRQTYLKGSAADPQKGAAPVKKGAQ